MDNEPYRDLSHHEARDMLFRDALQSSVLAAVEFQLPHGRIADVISMSPKGHIIIIEVKSEFKASLVAEAWDKYWPYSHRLWVAVPHASTHTSQPALWSAMDFPMSAKVGLLGVHREGNAVIRTPTDHSLSKERALALRTMLWSKAKRGLLDPDDPA